METLFPVITLVNLALALAAFVAARLSVRWPRVKWVVIGISVYLSGLYFLWRYLYTLNTSGPMGLFISLSLVLAETYGFIAALLFYFQTMSPREEECPVIEKGDFPSVDILITIYNESPEILYRTVVACMAIDYPRKKLYVCDDGQRQEIRELTERLG
ncbi:MAG: cellulose synthase catalytic subunit, partial [Acidobacteriota bacterium]